MSRAQVQRNPFLYPRVQWGAFSPPTSFNVLDTDDNNFLCPLTVLDTDDNSFTVTKVVLDTDDNSFVVI